MFFLVLCSSCKNSEKEILTNNIEKRIIETPVITNDYKLTFLNEILKDTIILRGKYENAIIFKKEISNKENSIHNGIKLISMTLSEQDTSFIYNQIYNDKFNIEKLRPFGHNAIDWKNIRDDLYIGDSLVKERVFVSTDSLESIYEYLEKNSNISLSKPIFNKSLNKAYIEVDFSYYYGNGYLFEKTNNTWEFIDFAGGWIR
ncbi:hypothetical protein FBALC1_03627 [Flavobacteriales bacterium ALC-1]|nr:hypothetical protein FBALC1_03627 [Flavobacteriales bacterium ALC-1]